MKMRKSTATAMLAATAVTITTASAGAAPAPAPAPDSAVHYAVSRNGDSAVLATHDGRLKIVGDQLVLTDSADRPAAAIPLTYRLDNRAYPIEAHIDGTTATLTPSRQNPIAIPDIPNNQAITVDQAAHQISESFTPRDFQALGAFAQRAAIGAAVSAVLGAVIGAGIGCLAGGAAGAAISGPVAALLLPFVGATIAGCVLGAATLGAVGSMIGLVVAGGPITLFSTIQYFSTILTPCPPELPACKDPAQPAPAPQ